MSTLTGATAGCHNIYLELLCETGLLGFCVFIMAMASSIVITWKNINFLSHQERDVELTSIKLALRSSSGGAFVALSDCFLDNGDAVVCAVYNYEDHATEFQLIENREERDKSIGSKYMQSKPGKIYKIAEDWLINHPEKRLLFVGMGCQADGFRKFAEMKGFRERVWIVDIICHGSPSPRLWKEYAESAEKKYGKITYLTFKDKRNGWKAPTAYVTAGGQEHLIKDYVKVFYNQCALRLSCYECPYATTERKTDMTIGDFWHIEETIPDFYDEKSNSIFLIHTDRGEQLFETVKVKLEYRLSDTKQCWQANLEAPTKRSEQRDEFWNDYQRKGVDFVMKKYGTTPLKTKIKNKLVKLISIGGGQTLNPDLIYYVDYSERRAA